MPFDFDNRVSWVCAAIDVLNYGIVTHWDIRLTLFSGAWFYNYTHVRATEFHEMNCNDLSCLTLKHAIQYVSASYYLSRAAVS